MTTTTELTPLLKRLKLGAVLNTLPERVALARRDQIDYASFLQIILTDEINRRDHRRLELRLQRAGFEQTCRLEDFDWSASITLDRRLLDAAFSLQFLDRNEHVLLVGPVGVGKSFIAQALGYAAVRAEHTVRFVHADDFFRTMAQARVDHSTDKTFRSFLAPDLLILDDLGLHRMTQQQSIDLYELVIARHRTASFVITSNRAVDEWLGLFDDRRHKLRRHQTPGAVQDRGPSPETRPGAVPLPAQGHRDEDVGQRLHGAHVGDRAVSERSTVLLEHHLKELKLPTFLREYGKVAGQCAAEGVDHPGYLLRLSELELIDRHHRMVARRIKAARFPATKSLDTFDFLAMPSVNKHLAMQLARCAFTDEQVRWLEAIRDHIAGSVSMTPSNFQYAPFNQQGGLGKACELFGEELEGLLEELNLELVA